MGASLQKERDSPLANLAACESRHYVISRETFGPQKLCAMGGQNHIEFTTPGAIRGDRANDLTQVILSRASPTSVVALSATLSSPRPAGPLASSAG
jgi:hypothetical protein